MRRRDLIALLGSTAVMRPLAARAQQQSTLPVIGFLNSQTPDAFAARVAAFHRGLAEVGYVEGQNVTFEYRWAEGHYDRLAGLAADLVERRVAVIAVTGGTTAAITAKQSTSSIPIVFTVGGDPMKVGLVASLNRPGGNATGVSILATELLTKRLEVLRELVPTASAIALLVNPGGISADTSIRDIRKAAQERGFRVEVVRASTSGEIESALATLADRRTQALLVDSDPFFESRRDQLAALAARYAIPAIFDTRNYADAGGLASYGTDYSAAYREAGAYVGRILRGAKPVDLPVLQLSKIELVINLKTAKALGLTIPPALLARADEVIE